MRTVADLVSSGTLAGLIPVLGSLERKHTLQFARVESDCLGAGGIARKGPQGLGGQEKARVDRTRRRT